MKEIDTDILIIGGGLSGLLTALALSSLRFQIIILDKSFFLSKNKSNNDLRTTAIAEGSKIFLDSIGLWKKISKYSEKINKIKVIDRKLPSNIKFSNSNKNSALGYVIKNTIIKKTIIKILEQKKNIKIFEGQEINNIYYEGDQAVALTNKYKILPKLIVSADGKKSNIRPIFKTPQFTKIYKHSALVVNFNHTKNHANIAHEIFFDTGPLAILPMKSEKKGFYSSSLIWSNNKKFVNAIAGVEEKLRQEIIGEKIIDYCGDITDLLDTKVFGLSAHINSKFFERRLVYIGDAAHSLHPIAGQGWNLGIRDIKNLYNIISYGKKIGIDIGSEYVCHQYHDLCFYDAYCLYQITDKLNSIFLDQKKISKLIRNFGFNIIDKNSLLKNKITNYAMGF